MYISMCVCIRTSLDQLCVMDITPVLIAYINTYICTYITPELIVNMFLTYKLKPRTCHTHIHVISKEGRFVCEQVSIPQSGLFS